MAVQINSASAPAQRQFPFFDASLVKDINAPASPPELFKSAAEISTNTFSSAGLIVADIHGSVHLLNKDFVSVQVWIAHDAGRVTHMAERQGLLVTLGEEDQVRSPLLKVWDLKRTDKRTGAPTLIRSTKVQVGNRPHPVSTVALSSTLAYLAIGLGDGTVLIYRHFDQSILSASTSLTNLPKPRTVHEGPSEPITGLGFKEPTEDSPHHHLFIVTTSKVLCYQASGRGSGGAPTVVDEIGAGLGCAAMDSMLHDIVLARDEGIYMCGVEGRGSFYAIEGPKSSIHAHQNYLVVVTPPIIPTGSSASATVRHFALRNQDPSITDITKITIFDPDNKLVAFSGTFANGVRDVLEGWGHVYVLANDGELTCLEEKPMIKKLEMLYQRSLYSVALNIAKTQKLDGDSVADIHRQFGDSMYSKADYNGAMEHYVQTIGHVQPSYVIRKYLDAQRIHQLVTYLQELHSLGLANSDHTTLLLNAYTKLKDVSRLDSFIKTASLRQPDHDHPHEGEKDIDYSELPFDLETAIRVCRQAGYFEHASYLAKKYQRHEDYLRIQIEDAHNYKDALIYLRNLGSEAAEDNLARYGRALLENLPDETTLLLIDLCTKSGPLTADESENSEDAESSSIKQNAGPTYLSYLNPLNLAPGNTTSVLEPPTSAAPSVKTVKPGDPPTRQASIIRDPNAAAAPSEAPSTPTSTAPPLPPPQPSLKQFPSPRLYFPQFVDHMRHFVLFLETVALRRWGQSIDEKLNVSPPPDVSAEQLPDRGDQVAVWNTLLELYLTSTQQADDSEGGSQITGRQKEKVMKLLRNPTLPYDTTHALILCSTNGYTPGLVLLWEKMGMYEDVLRFWMDQANDSNSTPTASAEASSEVIKHLELYGPEHPDLYPLVLRFLTSSGELLSRHTKDVKSILSVIEQEEIMPPLAVVQVLSRNSVPSVGLIKEWLVERIKNSRQEIHDDQQLIDSYRSETASNLKKVEELSDPEHPRIFHVTRCSKCGGQLDLPSIHFMCNHSYHQRCLPDNDTECPNCARQHGVIREIRANNERLANQHDVFLSEVAEGGFTAVATGFSRGILNPGRLEDVSA